MHWQNINKELQVYEISPAPDGIHPNLMLYKTIVQLAEKAIAEALKRK